MELQGFLSQVRELVNGKVVYGEPYERDGIVLIPAAKVRAGGGGGSGKQPGGDTGTGAGGGLVATPIGAWVIRGQDVTWQPAIDVGKVFQTATAFGVMAFLTIRLLLKRRPRGG